MENSHIGNLHAFLNNYVNGKTLEFSFLKDRWQNLNEWKTAARVLTLDLLNYFPVYAPFEPSVTGRFMENGYTREEIEFNTAKNVRIKGSFLIPHTGTKPFPAVIALHDHGGFYYFGREKIIETGSPPKELTGFKNQYYGGRSYASELARSGYAVLCIDAFYFGSRKLNPDSVPRDALEQMTGKNAGELSAEAETSIDAYNQVCGIFEALTVKHIFASGTTWPGILFHDDRKCVDYLFTRDEVDKNRIGCCGLSLGGYRSAFLAALDERISAAVVTGWMPTYKSLTYNRLINHTFMIYVPGLAAYMELPDLMGLAAPNAVFVQQCAKDGLFNLAGMREAAEQTAAVYKKAGCPGQYKYEFYDNGHEFNLKMQECPVDK